MARTATLTPNVSSTHCPASPPPPPPSPPPPSSVLKQRPAHCDEIAAMKLPSWASATATMEGSVLRRYPGGTQPLPLRRRQTDTLCPLPPPPPTHLPKAHAFAMELPSWALGNTNKEGFLPGWGPQLLSQPVQSNEHPKYRRHAVPRRFCIWRTVNRISLAVAGQIIYLINSQCPNYFFNQLAVAFFFCVLGPF
jgi:hypothetical protein